MSSLQSIRRRIRSISGTAQITRAMQMVAASKMNRAQQAALNGRPFARLLYRLQREVTSLAEEERHPLLEVREVRRRAVLVVSADKGLCGALNSNVFRLASQYDPASTVFVTAGRRAAQFVSGSGRTLAAEFSYGDNPTFSEARAIATVVKQLFLEKKVDQVQIVATRFVNTITQEPVAFTFLPVGELAGLTMPGVESGALPGTDADDCLLEPSPAAVLGFILDPYISFVVYQTLLNAKASEQSARMVSMKNATDSATDLINDLSLVYNKLRQGSITTELLEIAGGQAE